ncbi:MAG: YggN family protein [Aestuariibacter sp.]
MRFVFFLMLLLAFNAQADLQCKVDLDYGLLVSDGRIRVTDESRTVYQINGDSQLIIGGHWIEVNEKQAALLAEFSRGIHYSVPKMIILATEGVELAIETVEHVYTGLVGSDHKSFEKLEKALKRVHWKVKSKFIHSNENYYIGPGSLEKVDDLVDRELEEQIEQAINTSLGGILSAIGGLATGNDEDMEAKMESLSQKLEMMGAEIERTVGPKSDTLRKKAEWFCNKMRELDGIEDKLGEEIPRMKRYNIIISGNR